MVVTVARPEENFPSTWTENPCTFYDGADLLLCYRIAPVEGNGSVVIKFDDVIDFRKTPVNVDELHKHRYLVNYYAFNEVSNAEELVRWKALKPRFWVISFHDVTIEIIFGDAALVFRTQDEADSSVTLLKFLNECK